MQTLGPETTYWLQTSLLENTSYQYLVRAYNVNGESGDSNTIEKYTWANAPSALTVQNVYVSSVSVSFTGTQATQYDVVRSSDVNFNVDVATETLTNTTTTFTNLLDYVTYWFRVRGYNGNGVATAYANIPSTRTHLSAPTGFTGTVFSTGSIHWQWTDTSGRETGYKVYNATTSAVAQTLGAG